VNGLEEVHYMVWDPGKDRKLHHPRRPYFVSLSPSCRTDPLIGHGRHFGRTTHAFCNIHSLIVSGITWMAESYEEADEWYTAEFVGTPFNSPAFMILICSVEIGVNTASSNRSWHLFPASKRA